MSENDVGSVPRSCGITCDAIIIGGGFYGCEIALELQRIGFGKIVLVEREPGLLRRSSIKRGFTTAITTHGLMRRRSNPGKIPKDL
jgi:glycine/D-amino acid oxidase-like deaminating enzyme